MQGTYSATDRTFADGSPAENAPSRCLTEFSAIALLIGAAGLSALLWLAILAVI